MVYTENEVLQYIEENDVKFVKLTFCDIRGMLKNISVLSSEMSAVFERGVKITAKKICGFSIAGGRDLYLIPDSQTMSVLPWRPQHGRVIRMFCYIRYGDGTPFEGDGRYFLKQASKKALGKGWCFRFGTSSEFMLFRNDESGLPTKIPHDYAGYCDTAPDDKGENFRRDVCFTLEQMNIHPVSSRHEAGRGQHEIDFNASSALKAADTFLSFKSAVRSVAEQHGIHASFMPKPVRNDFGNGMHIGVNVFHDSNFFSDNQLSDNSDEVNMAAAGIMKFIRECALFTNSTINSYNRLGEFSIPRYITWSDTEEEQILKLNTEAEGEAPIVLRAPDCVCNPYFVFGLLIYSALDGIENKIEMPEKYSPENNNYEKLPENLLVAAETAENSEFLKKYIPADLLEFVISGAKEEWNEYSSEYDKELYEEKKYFYSL
ncbi:MAG: glutamine synthetase family protein [Ruminococcus sp.]|nr:glutamine synthetase family protein [Ruminococcus sp.]MDE7105093.1 glutamine synthetase family protein [Ruminococcus sp.]